MVLKTSFPSSQAAAPDAGDLLLKSAPPALAK